MPTILTMPKLSPTMEEGTIIKWCKKEGERFEVGDVLIEVATDKATVEHQAIDEGWLAQIIVQEGQAATINQPIAVFTEEKNESLKGFELPKSSAVAAAKPSVVTEVAAGQRATQPTALSTQARVIASPLAKRLAKEQGVDLSTVKGSGPRGRIVSDDLAGKASSPLVSFSSNQLPATAAGGYTETKLTPLRRIIAERLQESKSTIPHFYVNMEVNARALDDAYQQLKMGGLKVSYNDFVVRAVALALRRHPVINSGFNPETQSIINYQTIDIAIAVSIEGGLITPIVRHADYKNLGQLAAEIRDLAAKARSGRLSQDEYVGGSFTISNLGMYGVSDFQAIINPPQAAILAVGALLDCPVVRGGEVVAGKVMTLSLSSDHRVIDGAAAAEFLKTLKELLESPALLLI